MKIWQNKIKIKAYTQKYPTWNSVTVRVSLSSNQENLFSPRNLVREGNKKNYQHLSNLRFLQPTWPGTIWLTSKLTLGDSPHIICIMLDSGEEKEVHTKLNWHTYRGVALKNFCRVQTMVHDNLLHPQSNNCSYFFAWAEGVHR